MEAFGEVVDGELSQQGGAVVQLVAQLPPSSFASLAYVRQADVRCACQALRVLLLWHVLGGA